MNEEGGFNIGGARFLRSGELRVEDDAQSLNTSNINIEEADNSLIIDVVSQHRKSFD